MNENGAKRGLEKGTAIFSTVIFALELIGSIALIIISALIMACVINYEEMLKYITVDQALYYVIGGAIYFAISFVGLILSISLIPKPKEGATLTRVILLILAILSGHLITMGLLIGVLCTRDYVNAPQQTIVYGSMPNYEATTDGKIAQLKQLKEFGVIDETKYKKEIKKIMDNAIKD